MSDFKELLEDYFNKSKDFLNDIKLTINSIEIDTDKKNKINNDVSSLSNQLINLTNDLTKNHLVSDEDLEGFDQTINSQQKEIDQLKTLNEELKTQIKQISSNNSNNDVKTKLELESLRDKVKVFNSSLNSEKEKNENVINKLTALEAELNESKSNLAHLTLKYNNLLDENEINNKNLKKNFSLEKQVKELLEENEEFKSKLKDIDQVKNLKQSNERLTNQLNDTCLTLSQKEEEIKQLNKVVEKLKEENFIKFDKINALDNELRTKKLSISELTSKIEELNKSIIEINFKKDDYDNLIKLVKNQNEGKIKDLKTELENCFSKIKLLENENEELKKEVKNCAHIESLARNNKEVLTKKDFSILETMSRRIEELDSLNSDLKFKLSELSDSYYKLEKQKSNIEKNIFDLLKEETNLNRKKFESIVLNNENSDINGFSLFKTQTFTNEVLIESIINQKKENMMLKQQLADITIEVNRIMRNKNISG
jgi:chromosome segregation ATPase